MGILYRLLILWEDGLQMMSSYDTGYLQQMKHRADQGGAIFTDVAVVD